MTAAFARITDAHEDILCQLTPCAQKLYCWLLRLRPAGVSLEFDFEAFQEWSSTKRKAPYCLKQIKASLQQLIESGLVEPLRRYSARVYKLVVHHPESEVETGKKSSDLENKTSRFWNKTSKIQPSNADSAVSDQQRIFKEQTDTVPPSHPVSRNEQKKLTDRTKVPESINRDRPRHNWEKLQSAIAPQRLNQNLEQVICSAPSEVVNNAVELLIQQRSQGKVKNPSGFLVRAIRGQWRIRTQTSKAQNNISENSEASQTGSSSAFQPVENSKNEAKSTVPEGFNEWFELAKRSRRFVASMMQDGILYVIDELGNYWEYEEMRSTYPVKFLRRDVARQQAAIDGERRRE